MPAWRSGANHRRDVAPLITACKFVVEGTRIIYDPLSVCRLVIAPSVEEEFVVLGAGYPDGVVAGERIARDE